MTKVKLLLVALVLTLISIVGVGLEYLKVIKVKTIPSSEEIVKETIAKKMRIEIVPERPIIGESVRIIVRDSKNNPIEGVKVYITNETGKTFIGITDSNGELTYVFEWYGWYDIELEKEGFLPSGRPIHVESKGYLRLDISGSPKNGKWIVVITVYSVSKPVENAEIYVNGSFVGYTDSKGQLICVFEPNKSYNIVAKKEGFASANIVTQCPPLID